MAGVLMGPCAVGGDSGAGPRFLFAWKRRAVHVVWWLVVAMLTGCSWTETRRRSEPVHEQCSHLVRRAWAAREQGQTASAAQMLQRVLENCPQEVEAHRLLAEIQWARRKPAEAIRHLREAARREPDSPKLQFRLGQMLLHHDRPREAIVHLNEALDLNPDNAMLFCLRGEALESLGRREGAVASFHRALQIDPRHERSLLRLSRVQLETGKPEQALAKLRTVLDLALDPEHRRQAQLLLGQTCMALERWEEAAAAFAWCVRQGTDDPNVYYQLAYAQMMLGDLPKARESLAKVLQENPDHRAGRTLLERLAASERAGLSLR